MSRAEVVGRAGLPFTLLRLLLIGLFGAIVATLFGSTVFYVFLTFAMILCLYMRVKRIESNKRRQRAFMRKRKKVREVDMDCGRWGDYIFVRVFGITLAADADNPAHIKEMIFDVVRAIRSIEDNGKLPKGKFYS